MARCPHCQFSISFLRSCTAAPAFPGVCPSCGGRFYGSGALGAVSVASVGLVLGLASVALLGSESLAAGVVLTAFIALAFVAKTSALVPAIPHVVLRWRVAIAVLAALAALWSHIHI